MQRCSMMGACARVRTHGACGPACVRFCAPAAQWSWMHVTAQASSTVRKGSRDGVRKRRCTDESNVVVRKVEGCEHGVLCERPRELQAQANTHSTTRTHARTHALMTTRTNTSERAFTRMDARADTHTRIQHSSRTAMRAASHKHTARDAHMKTSHRPQHLQARGERLRAVSTRWVGRFGYLAVDARAVR